MPKSHRLGFPSFPSSKVLCASILLCHRLSFPAYIYPLLSRGLLSAARFLRPVYISIFVGPCAWSVSVPRFGVFSPSPPPRCFAQGMPPVLSRPVLPGRRRPVGATERAGLVAMQRSTRKSARGIERANQIETTRRATAMIIIRRPNNQCGGPPGKKPRAHRVPP